MTYEEALTEARLILDATPMIAPGDLARLDQRAAQCRDLGLDGFEMLADCLDGAVDRCNGDLEMIGLVTDVAYVAAVLITT